MEKNLIFLKPLTDELGKLLEKLYSDRDYEIFEIEDISELSQTLPILEQSLILNADLKVTRQYLEELKLYTTNMDCFVLLVNDKDIPPHIKSSLVKMGLNEVISSQTSSNDILNIITAFFEEGYQGESQPIGSTRTQLNTRIKWSKSIDENEEWKVQHTIKKNSNEVNRFNILPLNISTQEKNRIERLLSEIKKDKKNATLTKLKNGDLNFTYQNDVNDSNKIQTKIIGKKLTPEQNLTIVTTKTEEFKAHIKNNDIDSSQFEINSKEKDIEDLVTSKAEIMEQELEAQMQSEKSLDEMGLEISRKIFDENTFDQNEVQENQGLYYNEEEGSGVLERFGAYEKKDTENSKNNNFEELSYKRGEGTADFYDAIKKDEEEQRENFVVKESLNSENPFLSTFIDEVPKELIDIESKKEVEIVLPVKNDFLYMIGLSTILGNTVPHHQKLLLYINFVLNRKFEGIYIPIVMSNSKRKTLLSPWELDAFKKTHSECATVLDENYIALEEFNVPHFDVFNEWGVFIYPYFWERQKCGMGLMITKKAITESDKKFIELNMLCARNIVFEESLKC